MPAPLSVILPTLNAADELPKTLLALMPGVEEGLIREVIFADGGSTDDTARLADAAGAEIIGSPPSRGGQLRAGAAAARGDWYLFLHADTHLPADWTDYVANALAQPGTAYAFRLAFRASGLAPRIVAAWANLRSRLWGLPYGDQALLIHKKLYQTCGGYPDQPLMEDVAIARALKGQIELLPVAVSTSADRYIAQGWLRRGARNLVLLTRYTMGANPGSLARAYNAPKASKSNTP
ncbi:MAG: TIGR04283 family arsenosugar biosynthesis glycosyltransferase [Planktomarina sp.]